MLPKSNRLTSKHDFEHLLNEGDIIQLAHFGLVYKQVEDTSVQPRFGFIISNKISKKAVERNRIRRILRSVVRSLINNIQPGYMFVVLARKNILMQNHLDLEKELTVAFKHSGALK